MGMVQPKDRSTVPCNAPCTANRQELTAGGKKSIFPQQTRLSLMFWSSSSAEAVTVCQRGWRWGILHPSPNTARKRICQKPTVPSTKQAAGRALLSRIKRKIVRKLKIPYFLSYLNSSILALTFFTSKCSSLYWSQNVKHPEISVSKKQLSGTIFHFVLKSV